MAVSCRGRRRAETHENGAGRQGGVEWRHAEVATDVEAARPFQRGGAFRTAGRFASQVHEKVSSLKKDVLFLKHDCSILRQSSNPVTLYVVYGRTKPVPMWAKQQRA